MNHDHQSQTPPGSPTVLAPSESSEPSSEDHELNEGADIEQETDSIGGHRDNMVATALIKIQVYGYALRPPRSPY